MIVDELVNKIKKRAKERKILEVCIGVKYTGVLLDDGSLGLAATLPHQLPHRCESFQDIVGKPSMEAAKMVFSPHLLPSVVGAATINALLLPEAEFEAVSGDILDLLPISGKDTVGMVGAFLPLLPSLRKKTRNIYVFERLPVDGVKEYYPDWAEPVYLPRCSIVIISGTTVVNKTIDQVLSYLNPSQTFGLVGPTTPLAPPVFSRYGLSFLSGVRIKDSAKIMNIIKQAGGTKDFGENAQKVNYFLKCSGRF
ncbi:DUF364 domain-containing protein [Candidatus Aerophobetes bacterium]|nr:DUF364 domain-containing protein [Candidatus Aerophobetes bacterium]